ncbi:MAG: gliding motility-associated C-terminal domain-containing protein [Sphingobacteriales bacterium]|nr:MAG: gliding motility-associated C-terminal domain-containing protein [Sphingobacteriales bacterium]
MKKLITLSLTFLLCILASRVQAQCPAISSICIKSCATPEGLNEFFIFTTGTSAINVNNIDIDWATTNIAFAGFVQNTTTATKVTNANVAIDNANGCGNLIEPTGTIPANAKVIVFTSYDVDFSVLSFGALGEDMYVLFTNNSNSTGHFANNGSGTRSMTLSIGGALNCSQTVTYDRSQVSTANGASVSFNSAGIPGYFVNNCIIPSTPAIGPGLTLTSASANVTTCINTAIPTINFTATNATNVVATGLPAGVTGTWNGGSNNFTVSGTPTVAGIYNYKVRAAGACGADSILGTITVNPGVTATRNITICQGQSYAFYGATYTTSVTGITHTVVNPAGCDSIITLNLTVNPYLTGDRIVSICPNGSYWFNGIEYSSAVSGIMDTVPNATGCDSVITLYLTVSPYNYADRFEVICEGDSFVFNGTTYTHSVTGITDTINNPAGCDSIITFTLDVLPAPQQILMADTLIVCQYDTVALTAQVLPFSNDYTYNWSPVAGLNNSTHLNVWFIADQSIDYRLTVQRPTNGIPCTLSKRTRIIVNPGNFLQTAFTDTGICPGSDVAIKLSGAQTYDWSGLQDAIAVNSRKDSVVFHPQTSNDYTIVGTSDKGCKDTVQINIEVYPNAVLSMPDSVSIYPETPYLLEPHTNASYFEWFPHAGISSVNTSTPTFYPEVNTRYFVKAVTDRGCMVEDSIDILVKPTSLGMPNAFNPNYESFKIVRNGSAKLNAFRVYNRWGQLVFETQDIHTGWDGTFKGTPQPVGVYIYQVDASGPDGQRLKQSGNVTLLR